MPKRNLKYTSLVLGGYEKPAVPAVRIMSLHKKLGLHPGQEVEPK